MRRSRSARTPPRAIRRTEINGVGAFFANKGLNRFSLRGKDKVQGQWQLYCLVRNIEKIAHYGQMGLH
ncbi:transposase [Zhongshania sp.]|uniref:transposase n=1 Tax=Zhongshania sp. TaxID=1971902 RepID=UPI003561A228